MKKRILSIFVSLFLILNIIPLGVMAEEKNAAYPEFDLVNALGFMPPDISVCAYVTRSEATEILLKLRGITSFGESVRHFKDVSPYDEFYDMVHSAYSLGIIKGGTDGNFYPERNITSLEAVIMIMRTMGYSNIVDAAGGTSYDYLSFANQYGFLKGISAGENLMNAGEFARLIYNSFSIGIVEPTGFGDSSKYEVSSQKSSLSYTGIAMGEGILTDNSFASVHYTVNTFEKGKVIINGITYKTGNTNAEEMLGYNVKYFFFDNEDDIKTLKYIQKEDNKEDIIPLSYDVFSQNGKLCYFDENNKKAEYKISPEISLIVNGTAKPFDYSYIDNAGSTGEIILIDNGNAINGYDLIILNDYKNDIVIGFDEEENTVNLKYSGKTLLPDEDGVLILIKEGVKTELSKIESGTTVSYLSSDNGLYFKGILSTKTVEGKISAIDNNNNKQVFTIDGVDYSVSKDCNNSSIAELGKVFKFSLNFVGEISDVEWISDKNYAYVLKIVERSKDGEGVILTKLYTASGVKELHVAEKLSFNGIRTTKTSTEIVDYVKSLSDGELVTYKLNSDGEISDFTFCEPASGNLLSDSNKFTKYATSTSSVHYNGSIINKIGAKGAMVFFIPDEENINEEECRVSSLTRDNYYKNITFYDVGMSGKSEAILVRSSKSSGFSDDPKAVIFSRTVDAVDKDGEACKKMYYYKDGVLNSVFVDEDPSCIVKSNSKAQVDFNTLAFGDMIAFETDINGKLDRFALFFTAADIDTDTAITYGGGVVQSQAIMYMSGNLCYYQNGVASITHDGGFQIFSYSDACPLYIIDTKTKTLRESDTNNLVPKNYYDENDEGQRVILFGDRYTLKGAYAYE